MSETTDQLKETLARARQEVGKASKRTEGRSCSKQLLELTTLRQLPDSL